jgi:putative DNA primase/helicase
VDWLWHPYIPCGKLTAVAGNMGQAKSLFTVWTAAAVTAGRLGEPGSAVMLSAEDDVEDTILPRLIAAGADLDRVVLPDDQELDPERIAGYCDELGDVKLITIDPLSAFFGSRVDSWKSQHVRRALEPIRRLAQDRAISVTLVQHLNRGDSSDALARIADSQGIPALARSVLIWGASPSDPDGDKGVNKVLTVAKGNLARGIHSAEFHIEEITIPAGIQAPRLVYVGESNVRPEDITADQEARTQTDDAIVFLRDILADGAQEANVVKEAAREAGISDKCLRTARERIAKFHRPGGNHGPYVWELRTSTNSLRHSRHSGAFTGDHDPVNAQVAQNAQVAHT